MNNQYTPKPESGEQVIVEPVDPPIPDHAIQRFARFLLPKIQADLEQQDKSEETTNG